MEVKMSKRKDMNWCVIEVGQCFIYANELYMKIPENNGFNSVCLNDGELEYFSNEEYLETVSVRTIVL